MVTTMKLTNKEVATMLKVFTPKKLISLYYSNKIDLYVKDLNYLIELKNKKEKKV